MNSAPRKAKQFLTAVAKLLIVSAAFYFIYYKIEANNEVDWKRFASKFQSNWSFVTILILFVFSFVNKYLDVSKWKNLVSSISVISTRESAAQVLSAATVGIFTPNGIGDYGAKIFNFEKRYLKHVLFLNFLSNVAQMSVTIFFGIIGLIYLNIFLIIPLPLDIVSVGVTLVILGFVMLLLRKIQTKNISITRILNKFRSISDAIHIKNFILSVGRYFAFAHQYYFLFLIFDVNLPYLALISVISATYFVASLLPSLQIFDFAVKGSVAVFFFGFLNVNEWIVIFISTLMWFLNVVIPSVIGSYFIVNFKPKWSY